MIAPNNITFTPHEVYKLCVILLHKVGKVDVPKEVFDNFPKDAKMDCTFDPNTGYWTFVAPTPKSKRKRGIIKLDKRLFIPT